MEEIVIVSWHISESIGGIFRTIDGGLHWQQIDTSFSNKNIWATALTQDGRTLFIGGGFPGLYKTALETSVDHTHTEEKSTFQFLQNYPNPFNMNTNIQYRLLSPCQVSLKIFNMKGQEIRTLIDANQDKGMHVIQWDGRNNAGYYTASGIYIVRLAIDSYINYKKTAYLK